MALQVNVQDAKTRLSELLSRVEAGEEVTIARAGKPVARLVPLELRKRPSGFMPKHDIPDVFFFDPLPEEELRLWEGR